MIKIDEHCEYKVIDCSCSCEEMFDTLSYQINQRQVWEIVIDTSGEEPPSMFMTFRINKTQCIHNVCVTNVQHKVVDNDISTETTLMFTERNIKDILDLYL